MDIYFQSPRSQLPSPPAFLSPIISRKLRIGYISRRFERYPGAQLTLRLYGLHDRDNYYIICYAHGADDKSSERRHIQQTCDEFTPVYSWSPSDVAKRIRNDRIDVLIDFDGSHSFNNLEVLALRPAPVQVSFLGFAGTIGGDMGYLPPSGALPVVEKMPNTLDSINRYLNTVLDRVSRSERNHLVDFIITDPIITPFNTSDPFTALTVSGPEGEAGKGVLSFNATVDAPVLTTKEKALQQENTRMYKEILRKSRVFPENGEIPETAVSAPLGAFMAERKLVMPWSYQPQGTLIHHYIGI
jgi:hypothetical protein